MTSRLKVTNYYSYVSYISKLFSLCWYWDWHSHLWEVNKNAENDVIIKIKCLLYSNLYLEIETINLEICLLIIYCVLKYFKLENMNIKRMLLHFPMVKKIFFYAVGNKNHGCVIMTQYSFIFHHLISKIRASSNNNITLSYSLMTNMISLIY